MENIFGIYKKYWAKKALEGVHLPSTRVEGAPYHLGAPAASWAPWQAPDALLLLHGVFCPGKNHKEAFGTKCHHLEAEPGQK